MYLGCCVSSSKFLVLYVDGAYPRLSLSRDNMVLLTLFHFPLLSFPGVPNAQPDHASIMCRFAGECLLKMRGIVDSMADYLGRDTEELGLRVGLHSGATTAGVLRGERARFQLFGDTGKIVAL